MLLEKVDISPVVRDHLDTLRDHATEKRSVSDYVLFFGFPAAAAMVALGVKFQLHALPVTALVSSFSLFATMLLSLLVMVFTFVQSTDRAATDPLLSIRRRLLREINANISFAILVSVCIVAVALIALSGVQKDHDSIHPTGMCLLVFGFVVFVLNILMIVRRMYLLMTTELDRQKVKKSA